jgi:hypothetical protein
MYGFREQGLGMKAQAEGGIRSSKETVPGDWSGAGRLCARGGRRPRRGSRHWLAVVYFSSSVVVLGLLRVGLVPAGGIGSGGYLYRRCVRLSRPPGHARTLRSALRAVHRVVVSQPASQPASPYSHALSRPGRSARLEAADPHGSERPRPKARAPNALAAFRLRAHALARWLVVASPSHGRRPHLAASPPARALHDACAGFPLRGVACTAAEAAGWLATTPLII